MASGVVSRAISRLRAWNASSARSRRKSGRNAASYLRLRVRTVLPAGELTATLIFRNVPSCVSAHNRPAGMPVLLAPAGVVSRPGPHRVARRRTHHNFDLSERAVLGLV